MPPYKGASPSDSTPQDISPWKDRIYSTYRPGFEFAWRIALDEALTETAVNDSFDELRLGGGEEHDDALFFDELRAILVRSCIMGRKGSHFTFTEAVDRAGIFPFSRQKVVEVRKDVDFLETLRRLDAADRGLLLSAVEGVPVSSVLRSLGLSMDRFLGGVEAGLQSLRPALLVDSIPEGCEQYDMTDFRRARLGGTTGEAAEVLAEHLLTCSHCTALEKDADHEVAILHDALTTLPVPPGRLRDNSDRLLSNSGFSSMAGGHRLATPRVSREAAMLLSLLIGVGLVVAFYFVLELIYQDSPHPGPSNSPRPSRGPVADQNRPVPLSTKVLIAHLGSPNRAVRENAIQLLVAKGAEALPHLLPLTEDPDSRRRKAAQNVIIKLARGRIDKVIRAELEQEKVTEPELEAFRDTHRLEAISLAERIRHLSEEVRNFESKPGNTKDLARLKGRLAGARLAVSERIETTDEVLRRAVLHRRQNAVSLNLQRHLALATSLNPAKAQHYLRTNELPLSWSREISAALTTALQFESVEIGALDVLDTIERVTGLTICLDPRIFDNPLPIMKLPTGPHQPVKLIAAMTKKLAWRSYQTEGGILIAPSAVLFDGDLIRHLAPHLKDPYHGPLAAAELMQLFGRPLRIDRDCAMTSEKNRKALSNFSSWFAFARSRIHFNEETGRFDLKEE